MRPLVVGFLCATIACVNLSCSVNILENFADKTSDKALYVEAQKLIDDGDYTGALAQIAKMTGSYATSTAVTELKASAYAGRCGLNFLTFAKALQSIGATRIFPFLLGAFRSGSVSKIDDCISAEALMTGIGTITERTNDQNMFIVMVEFAKIGNILNHYADSNADGTADVGFAPCTAGGGTRAAGPIDDSDMRQIGSGLTIAMANITALAGSVNLGSSSLTTMTNVCGMLTGPLAAYNFCSVTDPAAFSASEVKGIRSFLKEDNAVGLGTDCTGDISTCNCP